MFVLVTLPDVLLQNTKGHVYTFTNEALARVSFALVKDRSHLYQVDADLQCARLVERGDGLPAPETVELTDTQRETLWRSFPYKSLLQWAPLGEET